MILWGELWLEEGENIAKGGGWSWLPSGMLLLLYGAGMKGLDATVLACFLGDFHKVGADSPARPGGDVC